MTQQIKGVVVCVKYDDLLAITLPRNVWHLSSCLVVTTKEDERTKAVVRSVPGCQIYETDAFTRHGATFNKSLAMEEAFDIVGRSGWIMVWDADVILPDQSPLFSDVVPGHLYSARRHVLNDARQWHDRLSWGSVPVHMDRLFPGYFHLFHADDPALQRRPWYDVTFSHAGGGDGYFQSRWADKDKVRFPWNVMHLGPIDTNWHGRVTDRVDGQPLGPESEQARAMQECYVRAKGWVRGYRRQAVNEHVEVPGHSPTTFKVGGT